jgi:hypothetical protein
MLMFLETLLVSTWTNKNRRFYPIIELSMLLVIGVILLLVAVFFFVSFATKGKEHYF